MSAASQRLRSAVQSFSASEIAFALAWEVYAPGLGGWTVQHDREEDGSDVLLVDPPLVYGDGFTVRPELGGVRVVSVLGTHRAASLREALLLICPIGADALDKVESLALAGTDPALC